MNERCPRQINNRTIVTKNRLFIFESVFCLFTSLSLPTSPLHLPSRPPLPPLLPPLLSVCAASHLCGCLLRSRILVPRRSAADEQIRASIHVVFVVPFVTVRL